jgi:hypothetical protein
MIHFGRRQSIQISSQAAAFGMKQTNAARKTKF